jgi:hypothetical protein
LIVAGKRAEVKVAEAFRSFGENVSFTNAVTEVYVAEEANVHYYKVQTKLTNLITSVLLLFIKKVVRYLQQTLLLLMVVLCVTTSISKLMVNMPKRTCLVCTFQTENNT